MDLLHNSNGAVSLQFKPPKRDRVKMMWTTIALPLLLPISLTIVLLFINNKVVVVHANPKSRPYVAYRTSPFDQEDGFVSRRIMENDDEQRGGEDGGR